MVQTEREKRTILRRAQVIEAASICFRAKGFHGASMAEIAEQSGMSVGHIYRYFPGKEALIKAIVEDIINRKLDWIVAVDNGRPRAEKILESLTSGYSEQEERDAALLLEVAAEATRNPDVAQLLRQNHLRMHELVRESYAAIHPDWSAEAIDARMEMMATLGQGFMFRRMTAATPVSPAFEVLLRDLLKRVLEES